MSAPETPEEDRGDTTNFGPLNVTVFKSGRIVFTEDTVSISVTESVLSEMLVHLENYRNGEYD